MGDPRDWPGSEVDRALDEAYSFMGRHGCCFYPSDRDSAHSAAFGAAFSGLDPTPDYVNKELMLSKHNKPNDI